MARYLMCKLRRQRFILLLFCLLVIGYVVVYKRWKTQSQLRLGDKNKLSEQPYTIDTLQVQQVERSVFPVQLKNNFIPEKPLVTQKSEENKFTPKTWNDKTHRVSQYDSYKYKTAVLVIACNRPSVGRCLDQLILHKPKKLNVPIIVSQDCGDLPTEKVILNYGKQVELIKQPILGDVDGVPANMRRFMGYYKISRHYKFAMETAFKNHPEIDSLIIVEDDLDIASDFYEYFLSLRPIMDADKSIWCISAWNDNGKTGFIEEKNDLLYRSDFFPGLGWMITRDIWNEIESKWPLGFWDDWMRNPLQRRDRVCIHPEISRTKTFGRVGVSLGQFFDQHLKYIRLNTRHYPFLSNDMTYLMKDNYDKRFLEQVNNSPLVTSNQLRIGNTIEAKSVRVMYNSNSDFDILARQFGVMSDLKAGVPRGAYYGIVPFMKNNVRVYLVPSEDWKGYHE